MPHRISWSWRLAYVVACLQGALGCSGTPRHSEEPAAEPAEPRAVPRPDAGVDAPVGPMVYEDERAPEGTLCMRTSECGEGEMCRGPSGCTSDWACGEALVCGEDRIAYCDCEGLTFHAPSGCAGRPYAHVGACASTALAELSLGIPDGDEPLTTADRICETNADCRRSEVCFGPSGCGVTLRCQRVRGCAGPRATFCGCDGVAFSASSACPGRSYLRRGECDGMIATAAESVDAGAGGTRVATAAPRDAGTAVSLPDAGTRVVASTPPPDAGARWTSSTLEDGSHTCRTSRDCRRPQICMGPPGCGEVWSCQRPPDACMRDTQYFCDCEGESFTASMNCPGRPFAHRGSCAIDQLLDLAGGSTH